MAQMLKARCPCGYEQSTTAGLGMAPDRINAPALCRSCEEVVTVNALERPRHCAECGSRVRLYPHDLREEIPDLSLRQSNRLVCPRCSRKTLSFLWMGIAD